jgi:hypothetical protein
MKILFLLSLSSIIGIAVFLIPHQLRRQKIADQIKKERIEYFCMICKS